MSLESVLDSDKGLILAPAGCGKTHLITQAINVEAHKPYLVLTHTTAGVAALKQRLKRLGVPSKNYVVSTIDGWALHVAKVFPISCVIHSAPENPNVFYPELRRAVGAYIHSGNIADVIRASYSRLLVDEYQDCDVDQHYLVCSLLELLPTVVFGDPMQCIFDFNSPMPSWELDVKVEFPVISELITPWRWINAGAPELGQWVLNCRDLLLNGLAVDLSNCPNHVHWNQLSGNSQRDIRCQNQVQYRIRNSNDKADTLLIIGDARNARARHNFASTASGIDVVEPVDLRDVIGVATHMDNCTGADLADRVLVAASSMMTGVGRSSISRRVTSIISGRNRTPATDIELAVKAVMEHGSTDSIATLINTLELSNQTRIYRRGAFSALKETITLSVCEPSKTTKLCAEIVRERRRHQGDRRISQLAIGSTLLLKGLECQHSLILDADSMTPKELYVALSRGAKSVTVFSRSNIVP